MADDFDFTVWSNSKLHKDEHFIKDGIIDPDHWTQATPKILFLAKEAYGDLPDLCKWLREVGPTGSWCTIVDWTYAITKIWETEKIPDYRPESIFKNNDQNWKDWLFKAAFVNVKKSKGKSSSYNEDLMKYATQDAEFLRHQIDWINPDIVVCCYTYETGLYDAIYPNSDCSVVSEWCIHHTVNGKQRLVIDFWHFANQYPNKVMYYALCAVLLKYRTTT